MDWMVRLSSGKVAGEDRSAFESWRTARPAHAAAWKRLEQGLATPLRALAQIEQRIPGEAPRIRSMLRQPARRSAFKALFAVGAGLGGAWLTDRVVPLSTLTTDFHTRTGQRRSIALDDGSRVILNARSAADVVFDATLRRVILREGDLIADVAPDVGRDMVPDAGPDAVQGEAQTGARSVARDARGPARPFCVDAGHVAAWVSDGRVLMSLLPGEVRVFALHGPVLLALGDKGEARRPLKAGQGLRCFADGTVAPVLGSATGAEWEQGYVSASPLPLGDVIAALRRYTPGVIRVSPAAARLPVQASLPLDDVDRALGVLADTLPIRVSRLSPWWITIDVAAV